MARTNSSTIDPGEDVDDLDREAHRGFVREMNRTFANVYAYGGSTVAVVTVGALVGAYALGVLGSPTTWIGTVVVLLLSLYLLRWRVRRRARGLLERIQQYCAVNEVSVDTLRGEFDSEELYPYFDSIFEVADRHRHARPS